MKTIKLILLITALCFISIQFFKPEIYNEKITKDFDGPKKIKSILKESCYDCHSNETNLAWFDKINPIYLLAREHVLEGRKYLNFSHWDSLNTKEKRVKLFDVLNVVKANRMPRKDYLFLHSNAILNKEKISALEKYILSLEEPVEYDDDKWKENKKEYVNKVIVKDVKPTLNGIDYIPDYKNWQVISTTNRFDNNSIRIIYANEIAVNAINIKQTNPYPDGSIIAKVVFDKLAKKDGTFIAGKFTHVEFMIKDSKKFASTKDWGWARWVGNEKKPFGKNNLFSDQCINCHKPVEQQDYVFTSPLIISKIK